MGLRSVRVRAVCLAALFFAGCSGVTIKSYVKQDGPWDVVQRVAVFPFETPFENPVRRNLITQLFSEELRKSGLTEVVELPAEAQVGAPDLPRIASDHLVDAVFFGAVDQSHGTVVHVRLLDATTSDVLWSGTYLLTARAEFLSFKTQQQKFQMAFAGLVRKFQQETGIGS